jgi:hypothetical protein
MTAGCRASRREEYALSNAKQASPVPPAAHPAVGLKRVTCPKCGGETEGKYEAKAPGEQTLVAQPHIRGMGEWCYPNGIPPRTLKMPPKR